MDHSEVKHLPKVDHTPADLDEPAKLLLKAAALIEDRGLERVGYESKSGCLCVMGAIAIAACGTSKGGVSGSGDDACEAWRRTRVVDGEVAFHWIQRAEVTPAMVVAHLRSVALAGK